MEYVRSVLGEVFPFLTEDFLQTAVLLFKGLYLVQGFPDFWTVERNLGCKLGRARRCVTNLSNVIQALMVRSENAFAKYKERVEICICRYIYISYVVDGRK